MKTQELAVVTATTLQTYRMSGFEAGNIFPIQSRTKRGDGESFISLICADGLIRGYQERFFDVKDVYEPTAEEIISKRLKTTLEELLMRVWESDPAARTDIQKSIQGVPNYPELHAETMADRLCEFIQNECGDQLLKLADWAQPFEEPEEAEV